jgi:cation diffusion facilitator CzcD-associated flavoprotein CzcO
MEHRDVLIIGAGPSGVDAAWHLQARCPDKTYVVLEARDAIGGTWDLFRYPGIRSDSDMFTMTGVSVLLYQLCRRLPGLMQKFLIGQVRRALGPDVDVATHFTPTYKPWEQRLCIVPDGDLFEAIKCGRASVVTDHIDTFTEKGIRLTSGRELDADIIVTATGLVLEPLGGVRFSVDGRGVDLSRTLSYKGVQFSDVPNLAAVFGYINASWTLRADLLCDYVCRLLQQMDQNGYAVVTPRNHDAAMTLRPFVEDFSSGYVQRSIEAWPKQGSHAPWTAPQNHLLDAANLRLQRIDNEALEFSRA